MSRGKHVLGPLTDEQQRLVRENIGLVAVHLRRYVVNLAEPRRDREWEDLFQEGCLGLIRAALGYRPEQGIPFAAFALPRIHNAVSRALECKFATFRVRSGRACRRSTAKMSCCECGGPQRHEAHSLPGESGMWLVGRKSHHPLGPNRETIGDRLRGKYERAVQAAAEEISRKKSKRGDLDKLVRILVEERLMVPHEESRRALRQIARDTRSSYARVAQFDRQLRRTVRETLDTDPEFRELQKRVRGTNDGIDMPIDNGLERELAQASAETFAGRFSSASPHDRACMLNAFMELSDVGILNALRTRVSQLPMHRRERLIWKLQKRDQKSR